MNNVLVIVISYLDKINLDKTLLCLKEQTYNRFDVIVWDNEAKCLELQASYPGFTFHSSDENMFWSPAINEAAKLYLTNNHEYIVLINNDIQLPPCAIERMVKEIETLPDNPGIVAPAGCSLGGLQDYVSYFDVPKHSDWKVELQEIIKDRTSVRSSYITGAVEMIKRELWDRIGGLDNCMVLGADDFDYSIRAKEMGYSLWVMYNVYVNHIGHASKDSKSWSIQGKESWQRFSDKYDGYFASDEEAEGSLWGAVYNRKYPIGTGLTNQEKINRGIKNVH